MDIPQNVDVRELAGNIFNYYNSLREKPQSIILYNCSDLGEQVANCLTNLFRSKDITILVCEGIPEPSRLQNKYSVNIGELVNYPLEFISFYCPRSVQELARDI